MLREKLFDDLPKTLLCILSGKQDCGLEAELTKSVFLELGKPLLMFTASLRSQTCPPLSDGAESAGFLRAYLRMAESAAVNGLQQAVINILSSLPVSAKLVTALGGMVDVVVANGAKLMATLLQVPMDYINIVLQFGIRIPSLDGKETCEQGERLCSTPHFLHSGFDW